MWPHRYPGFSKLTQIFMVYFNEDEATVSEEAEAEEETEAETE